MDCGTAPAHFLDALSYRIVVSLSVCPVCDVGVLLPNGRMNQDETCHAGGPRPGHIVLDGDIAPLSKGAQPLPNFRPISVVAKRLHGS